ncbi:MAG TPA: hypothetical protein VGK73_06795 [Polyangiaceae bacterium]
MFASLAYPTPRNTLGIALFFPALIVGVVVAEVFNFSLKLMGRKGRG